jgi:hypothetical protein
VTRSRCAALFFLIFAVAGATAAADEPSESRFHFKMPKGWKDQSPEGDRNVFVVATDETNKLVFQARVAAGGDPANHELLEKFAGDAEKSVLRRVPGMKFDVISKELVKIGGVTGARFIFETTPPGDDVTPLRMLQFYLPARDQHAIITFTSPAASFQKFLPQFEQIARGTTVKK